MFWDYTYLLLIPGLLLGIWAQVKVQSNYKKYAKVYNESGITGAQAAALILHQNRVENVTVTAGKGTLTDHYDSKAKVIRLSEGVYASNSLAAVGIAAHEASHAVQDAEGYLGLKLRNAVFPIASLGSGLALPMVFIGLVFSSFQVLIDIGIFLFGFAVLFHLVTLPVEINASRRALDAIKMEGVLSRDEAVGAKKVLSAAALTYVAALVVSVLQFLRLILLSRGRD